MPVGEWSSHVYYGWKESVFFLMFFVLWIFDVFGGKIDTKIKFNFKSGILSVCIMRSWAKPFTLFDKSGNWNAYPDKVSVGRNLFFFPIFAQCQVEWQKWQNEADFVSGHSSSWFCGQQMKRILSCCPTHNNTFVIPFCHMKALNTLVAVAFTAQKSSSVDTFRYPQN